MEPKKYIREACIALLQEKQKRIRENGEERLPQRADFSNEEIIAVKAFLGPWPRALEAAGLKESRGEDRREQNRLKRERAVRRQKAAKKAEKTLQELLDGIGEPDAEAAAQAEARQQKLAKPLGSLGRLEELSVRLAGISGKVRGQYKNKMLLVFCADNGVVEEGISVSPQEVTRIQACNLAAGKTGAGVLAREAGCGVRVYDVGINGTAADGRVIDRKIRRGTANLLKGPAMPREEAVRALMIGAHAVREAAADGAQIIGIGELGIGNTTTSSAVLSALTGVQPEEVTGRGGGLTDQALIRKTEVIREALALNRPDREDPIDVLSKVGGYDIAAMAGAFIGCAAHRVPAVIDGFISVVAALCAVRLCPRVRPFLIASHQSCEKGYRIAAGELELSPLFDLQMRLGEGSGCPIAMKIIDSACAVMDQMATFEEAEIDDSYLDELRRENAADRKGKAE